MGYKNLRECVTDLERTGQLIKIPQVVDANLEVGAIQRRVYQAGGPALLFTSVKNCAFPLLGNLFGTIDRTRFLFRDTLDAVKNLIDLKVDPSVFFKKPLRYTSVPSTLLHMLPKKVKSGPVIKYKTSISELPQIKSWPADGGAFITLPQVYTESVFTPGLKTSNLGMYRIQLSGNHYQPNEEIGLHYQIHRGIGVHHAEALKRGVPFRVNIFVGGTPAMTLAAVMPLPEGLSELYFAGALSGHRIPMICQKDQLPIYAEADFCISGTVIPQKLLPEGPFGDHLGYYSLSHDYPVLQVDAVTHRPDAIWPFTTVGRPPQEDTAFGELIHEITGPLIPTVLCGVHAVHAVDATGVHPLLLAIGSERYTPYRQSDRPQELLTQAHALLGQGQLSLAKYLMICNRDDAPALDINDTPSFFRHVLERIDWSRDLHFETCTTIDTLDYSGEGFNKGSKVVLAACGPKKRALPVETPLGVSWPDRFGSPVVAMPGILVVRGPSKMEIEDDPEMTRFCDSFSRSNSLCAYPLIVIVDDSEFCVRTINNFLWVTFTRSNPAIDIYGIESFIKNKHWGCHGSLVIDARLKPHHAPPLVDDPAIEKKVDALGAPGKPLHGII